MCHSEPSAFGGGEESLSCMVEDPTLRLAARPTLKRRATTAKPDESGYYGLCAAPVRA